MDTGYSIREVIAVAKRHPFYNGSVEYPPSREEVQRILEEDVADSDIQDFPLTSKADLYKTIERLVSDRSPENTFRHGCYLSITGGGFGGMPMLFATDTKENRRHRAAAGALVKACGLIQLSDLVISLHSSGGLYRALDLVTETVENADGSVLCCGHSMPLPMTKKVAVHYRANAIMGDGSQVLQFANYIASLPASERAEVKITKVIYTSESLSVEQRNTILAALDHPRIYSVLGSAEAGIYAVSNQYMTGESNGDYMDFIFDTRMMNIEILSPSVIDSVSTNSDSDSSSTKTEALPEGETGIIIQTSLSRLRNPLVRYITGDVGSLQPLPTTDEFLALGTESQHFKILRLYGRDRRFSFAWFGEYFEYHILNALVQTEGWGILQWQVILEAAEDKSVELEVRLYRSNLGEYEEGKNYVSDDTIVQRLRKFFSVHEDNDDYFKITFVCDLDGFERSSTGRKVVRFVNRSGV
ncbi:hypothetical protein AA313_de0202933 [Arthrobotrys entomopaga]|nr:hypothetical protein AA313_de0202933 [Arthrobotrys entomopaga]